MAPFSLRRATSDDLELVLTIDDLAAEDAGRRAWIERTLTGGGVFLLEEEARPVAYGVLDTFFGHPFVAMLYVPRRHRGVGAGEALLRHLTDVTGAPKVFSSTNLSNAPMHALFRKLGWVVSGLLDHLDEGDPEVVYVTYVRLSDRAASGP